MGFRRSLALVIAAAFFLVSTAAFAGTGKVKVYLKNEQGVTTNGKVTLKKGSTVKTCDTASGTCTITGLDAGGWTLSGKTASGSRTGGPQTVTAESGKTKTVTLVVRPASSGGR